MGIASHFFLARNDLTAYTVSARQRRQFSFWFATSRPDEFGRGFHACWGQTVRGFSEWPMEKGLIANSAAFIASETRSPKELTDCTHSTYEFLIANEFHRAVSAFRPCDTAASPDEISTKVVNFHLMHKLA